MVAAVAADPAGDPMACAKLSRRLFPLLLLLLAAFTVPGGLPARAGAPLTECDLLAAHPTDPDRVSLGVYWNVMDGRKAMKACAEAVKQYPDSLRLAYQYGRSLIRMRLVDEALPYLFAAANGGYKAAYATLGGTYQYELGNYGEALRWFRAGAKKGSAAAMQHLGDLYDGGYGVKRDRATALSWYRKAALQGDPVSENNIGWYYERGFAVDKDEGEAVRWYRKAALKGFGRAQINLGRVYEFGIGVGRDLNKAFDWYRRAAMQGQPYAQIFLARMLERGKDPIARDYAGAFFWYRLASRAPYRKAAAEARDGAARVEKRLDRAAVAAIDKKVTAWERQDPRQTVIDLLPAEERARIAAMMTQPVQARADAAPPSVSDRAAERAVEETAFPPTAARPPESSTPAGQGAAATDDFEPMLEDITLLSSVALYGAPDAEAAPVATLPKGQIVTAMARDAEGGWLMVADAGAFLGYIRQQDLKSGETRLAALPADAIPQPRPKPRIKAEKSEKGEAEKQPGAQVTLPRQAALVVPATREKAPVADEGMEEVSFGNYYALVVGNNDYKILPPLRTAIADARAVAEILQKDYGYKVTLLINASRADIVGTLDRLRQTLQEDDNLLIYYAGHGVLDAAANRGFWLPVEASDETMVDWVSTATVTDALKAMEARQVMIVADSCYSGALTRSVKVRVSSPSYYRKMLKKRARVVLSAGGLEPVLDGGGGKHSVFAKAFIDALKENDGVMDGNTLFNRLRRPVMLNSTQTPEYRDIRFAGHDGGDFLFVRVN